MEMWEPCIGTEMDRFFLELADGTITIVQRSSEVSAAGSLSNHHSRYHAINELCWIDTR